MKKLLTLAVVTAGVASLVNYCKKSSEQNQQARHRENFNNQPTATQQATVQPESNVTNNATSNTTTVTNLNSEDVVKAEETVTTEEVQAEKTEKTEDVQAEETATTEEVQTEKTATTEEVQAEEIATTEEVQTEEIATTEEVQTEEPATTEEVQAEETATTEEVQAEETAKTEEVQAEETTTTEEVKTEETATTEEVQAEETATTEEVQAEETATTEEVQAEEPVKTEETAVEKDTVKTVASVATITGTVAGVVASKETDEQEKSSETETVTKKDEFTLTGAYHWTFYLGFIKQKSTHIFAKDYIDYQMRGIAHSTDYRIEKISYDDSNKKWIGKSEDGTVYVLFFKDISDKAITIYKHKCTGGLTEAIDFARPADDETKDHGWNVYVYEGIEEQEDVLPFKGEYHNEEQQLDIDIKDEQVSYQGKNYTKLTHHTGEKRWVGHFGNELLVLFYQPSKQDDYKELLLAVETFDDEERAYKVKHDEQTFIRFVAE